MIKGYLLIGWMLLSITATPQVASGRLKTDMQQTDSATLVKQWLLDAVSLSEKDTVKANQYFSRVIQWAWQHKNQRLHADANMKYAQFLFDQELMHRSFANFLVAKNTYSGLDAPNELAMATLGVAKTQYYRGNYRNSQRNMIEAVTLARQLRLNDVESEASEFLGLLYNATQNFSAGIQYTRSSLEMKNRVGDSKGVIRMANRLSEMYYDRRKFDSSYYYASMALEGAESMKLKTDLYSARLAKTAALIRLQRWKEANSELTILAELKASYKKDANFFVRYNVMKGNYYLSQKKIEQGNIYYDTALSFPNRNSFPELFALIYKNMAESYYETGDYKKAYEYYKQYNEALGQLVTGENARNLGGIETLVDAEKSKDEIIVLNTENKLKQLELLRQSEIRLGLERENALMDSILRKEKILSEVLGRENAYKASQLGNEKKLRVTEAEKLKDEKKIRNILILALGSILVLGSIIFYQFRRQQFKTAIIEKQSLDLQELMREIHHRVKNNLQVVSSLLNLQSNYIKDAEAVGAVKDSRNRVLSMALIHQSLYQEGDLKSVNVPDYIDKLCSSLFQSYNISPERIRLEKDIQPLTMNLDALLPVGLIINELITNSLKYAFPGNRAGTVKISLFEKDATLQLKVQDDGAGLPAGFDPANKGSFGFKMINSFLQKLKGDIRVYSDKGTHAVIQIKNYK